MNAAQVSMPLAADGPLAWLLIAAVGAAVGWLLTTGVAPLVDPEPRAASLVQRLAAAGAVVSVVGLWWWEVVERGQLSAGASSAALEARGPLVIRYAAHVVLFALLAAAAWVDLRHRVIPDAITVPGVLVGMLWSAVFPGALLPIENEVPRSFAPPLLDPDVLGPWGGLHGAAWPGWLGSAPVATGLLAAAGIFAVWWLVGTDPGAEVASHSSARQPRRFIGPRGLVALAGGAIVGAAWLVGGDHWRGLASSLAGVAVSAGIVWLTRAGASRAVGREAMGLGDVTLMAMVGAWLGWQPCVLACFLGVFIGLAHGIVQVVIRNETELPFGPSLCLASAAVVVWWRPLWERTAVFFERPHEMALVVAAVIVLTAVSLWAWRRIRPFPAG
jgi:leader peptidase (prepilin peptidase) / N-methyltransferase